MSDNSPFIPSYHDLLRPEIASLIPRTAKHILDLGCGSAALGAHIKARQPCIYHGIENNAAAAHIAQERIDHVFTYSLDNHPTTSSNTDYDIIIAADILEHLLHPKDVLHHFAKTLSKQGKIIASIPNIAHPSIVQDLAHGLFRYQDAGILDRTHITHFTMVSIFQMFSALNLKITSFKPFPSAKNPIQYLITAVKSPYYNATITASIIIPSSIKGNLLKRTIDSIIAANTTNARIIVVNNGLISETTAWIESEPRILEIRCPVNLGFTTGTNLGMEISDTPYTVLCNDDIIVSHNWLSQLIRSAESDDKIGIVGPISNKVSGPQMDKNATYRNEKELSNYALKVTKEGTDRLDQFHRIVFFCTLIKKEVINKIGNLDEIYSPGNFEDNDYCLRAIEAGFKCMIDRSVFIHHECSQTTKADPQAYQQLMERNQTIFLSRWGSKLGSFLNPSS
jgi:GT2 family glycosyltransferase/2-polyprenyl-3-methyl-5-hydroxy-6-metoxy-1,4-benzoquinol methylase